MLKYVAAVVPLTRQAKIVTWLLPSRHWYRFALFASRLQGRLKARNGGNGPLTEALMLDNWVRAMTFSGPFPIPWYTDQTDVLNQKTPGRGTLHCWTHLPLVEIPLRALTELGHSVELVVAHPGKIVNGDEFIVPGLRERIKTISVDRRVLSALRTALKQGRSVACLADSEIFGPLSSQVLGVAGMVGAFVIFQWAERQSDGTLKVIFRPAPRPACENDEAIAENLEFLRTMNQQALEALDARPD